jgi:hypothetical protein
MSGRWGRRDRCILESVGGISLAARMEMKVKGEEESGRWRTYSRSKFLKLFFPIMQHTQRAYDETRSSSIPFSEGSDEGYRLQCLPIEQLAPKSS